VQASSRASGVVKVSRTPRRRPWRSPSWFWSGLTEPELQRGDLLIAVGELDSRGAGFGCSPAYAAGSRVQAIEGEAGAGLLCRDPSTVEDAAQKRRIAGDVVELLLVDARAGRDSMIVPPPMLSDLLPLSAEYKLREPRPRSSTPRSCAASSELAEGIRRSPRCSFRLGSDAPEPASVIARAPSRCTARSFTTTRRTRRRCTPRGDVSTRATPARDRRRARAAVRGASGVRQAARHPEVQLTKLQGRDRQAMYQRLGRAWRKVAVRPAARVPLWSSALVEERGGTRDRGDEGSARRDWCVGRASRPGTRVALEKALRQGGQEAGRCSACARPRVRAARRREGEWSRTSAHSRSSRKTRMRSRPRPPVTWRPDVTTISPRSCAAGFEVVQDTDEQLELYFRRGAIFSDALGDLDQALACYTSVLEHESRNRRALESDRVDPLPPRSGGRSCSRPTRS